VVPVAPPVMEPFAVVEILPEESTANACDGIVPSTILAATSPLFSVLTGREELKSEIWIPYLSFNLHT